MTAADPLAELRDQLRATTQAAERLAREGGARARSTPPAGSASSQDPDARQQELQALVALAEALRGLVPEELKELVRDLLRQLLLLARGLVDRWVERVDGLASPPPAPGVLAVEELPID